MTTLLGILQGLTEFLPISSSGHLFLAEKFLNLTPNLQLEIWLHGASLLALLIFFRTKIHEILKSIALSPKSKTGQDGLKLAAATICTVPIALLIEPHFENFLSTKTVALTLILTGLLILIAEKFRPKKTKEFSWPLAIALGLLQGFAVIPGISRSGLTIAFLILLGIERKRAAELSFLLAIPTIIGAIVFTFTKNELETFFTQEFILGFTAAFIASLLAIKWMLKLVEGKWIYFSFYCAVLGIILLTV